MFNWQTSFNRWLTMKQTNLIALLSLILSIPVLANDHHGHGHRHDPVNMPGLQGKDTQPIEVEDLKTLFRRHPQIKRDVTLLFNGVQTTTESDNPDVRTAIVRHVSMMVGRLESGQNPEVIIQSPTLDALFAVAENIETQITPTAMGVRVTQTSRDAETVRLLQQHAGEVSEMATQGMHAVHRRMMGH